MLALKDKNILVTGGAGFVGTYTILKLLNCGANVRILDNFSHSLADKLTYEQRLKKQNLKIDIVEGDIRNWKDVVNAVNRADAVIHLASLINVMDSMDNQMDYYENNVIGLENIVNASINARIKKFVFASSCAVYGNSRKIVFEDHKLNPISFYASTKLIGEDFLRVHKKDLNSTILRYFNVFGIGQKAKTGAVIPTFAGAIANNEPVVIFGTGKQIRDFVYVDDVADANCLAIQYGLNSAEAFNICNQGLTINTIYKILKNKLNPNHKLLQRTKKRKGDIDGFVGNCKLAENLYFKPKYTIRQGFNNMFGISNHDYIS